MKESAKSLQERVAKLTRQLEDGVKAVFSSDRYAEYLQAMSKFYRYSYGNVLLILAQCPHASQVAGYRLWRDEFGRQVKRGEKGIAILAPSTYHRDKLVNRKDPDTGATLEGPDGQPLKETQRVKLTCFVIVHVFDVSQTEGKEVPGLGVNELTGSVEGFSSLYDRLVALSPLDVVQEDIPGEAKGMCCYNDQRIVIRPGMSQVQTVKTLIHEIAHAKLHDPANVPKEERKGRSAKEVEAESVAYVVCQRLGIDTSDYSFGYVAGWSQGKELSELKASLNTIQTTAAALIDAVLPQERKPPEKAIPKPKSKRRQPAR